ncbi:Asp23/Gls24 family envelope stress response protein [Clostridium gasigenes]|uniref:Asp23/Gls24 family envelope stress response protein n=1 Tax=Clostridium gasigenes TaxID=94869 RepID=A0A1H0RAT7_9CLOT|nr:Asp23/Gls24 family envelope stress response protein [Clostridium gasigenes]MBB6623006.1 Asp23/Gls24 family envelope stress response protein [Clostridium gasigenes]MBB6715134.1 Asp23/Gls24 family envelope stress response protein [Clostridium gasigenes]MBU3087776.1 Asp23/Gls24 family envelope stress response protein [Clostridium gasigenes]MBU3104085.1 Asp23/Gls24 family envelope stress response protein [Clostridium gasigenes]MBU3107213.1 Asp23/Gls24 family envelope stress response protein [Cl
MLGYSNDLGTIHYSEEVLGKIVGLSTMECYGVVGMVSKNATEGLWEIMRIENLSKGVKLNFNEDDKLVIELFIMVEYGTKISVIANNIIKKVRYSVENFTGLKVSSVTVNVQAVRV